MANSLPKLKWHLNLKSRRHIQSNLWITTTEGTGSKWSYFSGGLICQVWFKNFQRRVLHLHEPATSAIGSHHVYAGAYGNDHAKRSL